MRAEEAIKVLEGVIGDVCDLTERVGSEAVVPRENPSPRQPDVYALLTLGAVHELASGVLDERRAQRPYNAARLARHLYEYDVETSWVVTDPPIRIERRYAEDLRQFLEYGDGSPDSPFEATRPFIEEVRAKLSPAERDDRYGRLMPSRRTMARERVPVEEYDKQYGRLSHQAHPSLAAGLRFVRLVDEEGREMWRPPSNPLGELGTLLQAAYSSARCLGRLAPVLGVDVTQGVIQALVTVDGIGTSEIEG